MTNQRLRKLVYLLTIYLVFQTAYWVLSSRFENGGRVEWSGFHFAKNNRASNNGSEPRVELGWRSDGVVVWREKK